MNSPVGGIALAMVPRMLLFFAAAAMSMSSRSRRGSQAQLGERWMEGLPLRAGKERGGEGRGGEGGEGPGQPKAVSFFSACVPPVALFSRQVGLPRRMAPQVEVPSHSTHSIRSC